MAGLRGWKRLRIVGGRTARGPRARRRLLPSRSEIGLAAISASLLIGAWSAWHGAPSVAGAAETSLTGRASVIDGDTIEIRGERIRILDIDAPESRQTCSRTDGAQWRCGQQAALALSDWIGQQTVACATTKRDKYGRWLARCAVNGQDLGEWMAAEGWVVPFRDCKCETIRSASETARSQNRGIWAGTFIMPWEWRAAH
jgi:endonuclease YncB( thermonuclease family)